VVHSFLPFDVLEEAEIDLAVGELDLLILPESEIDSRFDCDYDLYPTSHLLDWFMVIDLPDYDLLPAALSYCLKQAQLGSYRSLMMRQDDSERFFAANLNDARSLYSQMPDSARECLCFFSAGEQFPHTVSALKERLRSCGGSLKLSGELENVDVAMVVALVDSCFGIEARATSSRELLAAAEHLGLSWSGRAPGLSHPDSSELRAYIGNQLDLLSHWLASETRGVPLGMTRLIIVARPEAHPLRYLNKWVDPGDFYLVRSR
jgi:hypothetical protein